MPSKMEFSCKLAHSDEVKKVSNFNSIKELYEKICQIFQISINEILYCTLNTHNFRDTNSTLGNYLSIKDLIVVHLCGSSRTVSMKKTQEYIGLTITDNHHGRAFVKRIRPIHGQKSNRILPGDHIAAINSESMVSLRHFEVAKAIRAIPLDTSFTMTLVEPKHYEEQMILDLRGKYSEVEHKSKSSLKLSDNNENNSKPSAIEISTTTKDLGSLDLNSCEDLIDSSLPMGQLLSKTITNQRDSNGVDSSLQSSYHRTIENINSILESFLGIDDNLLAIRIYRLAHDNKHSFKQFLSDIKTSELSVFNFDDEIQNDLWSCANGRKNK